MAYIIDGNNVMGQTVGWHRDKSGSRIALLRQLAEFSRRRRIRVSVVFDGSPERNIPEGSAIEGVKVLYAEPGSDADTRIQRLVERSLNPRGLTVVTSDRHLAFLVRARGAAVMRSGQFRKMLDDQFGDPGRVEKKDTEGVPVDEWMRYFGALPEDDDETA